MEHSRAMIRSRLLALLPIAVLACDLMRGQARAQTAPSTGPVVSRNLETTMVALGRVPGDNTRFTIRLMGRYGLTGCPKVGHIPYAMTFQDIYLDISAGDYRVDMNDLPQHPEYQCGGRTVYPSATIPIDMKALKANGTQQIRFETLGQVDYFDVVRTPHYLELDEQRPRSSATPRYQPMVIPSLKNPLKIWLYPPGTVILKIAGSAPAGNAQGQVDAVARAKGLTPLNEIWPDFVSPLTDTGSFYYVDKTKARTVANDPNIAAGINVGSITLHGTVYGATGDETVDRPVPVFAHRPGAFE